MKNSYFKRCIAHILSVLMILSTMAAGLTALGFAVPEAYAASLEGVQKGNTINMGLETEGTGFTGNPVWTVIKVVDEDNDGANDKALLLSKYLWKGNGGDDSDAKMPFNTEDSNSWDGSQAKIWCDALYQTILLQSNLLVSTNINDGLDGNYGSCTSSNNKMFFLSTKEVSDNLSSKIAKYPNGTADKWWTRTPHKSLAKYAYAYSTEGEEKLTLVTESNAYRPAFWLDLSSDFCATKSGSGIATTWTINVNNTSHNYGTPSYAWAEDNSSCTASATCSQCQKELTETVNATSSESGGKTTYTADFENELFETQTKEVEVQPAEKPAVLIEADEDTLPAAGGSAVWAITGYDEDLEDVVTSEDFTLTVNAGDGWTASGINATFEIGNNLDEGTVTATIPANESQTARSWMLEYSGDIVDLRGAEAECPVITQAAAEPVSQDPLITGLSYNKTQFDAAGGAVNVAITGSNLDKLTKADFAIDLKGIYGDWEAQTYAVPLTYTASSAESAALTFTLPANTETSEKEYRLTAKTGADSVSNKQQILKVAAVIKAEPSSITYSSTELDSNGGEVTATISGSNLDKFAQDDFRIHVEEEDEYLGPVYTESNIRPDSFEATSESATVTFTLPANATAEIKNYKVRVIKTRGQWSNTYYKSSEVTGADQVITVASAVPAAKITEISYDETELGSEGGLVTASIEGEGLTGISSSDFTIEKKDLVYDEEEYDYVEKFVPSDIVLTYTATDNSNATLTFTLPENTGNKDALYRVTANKGADELSNKQQELAVKTSYVPPTITKVEVAPSEVSSASESVTLTVTGTNLEKIWYQLFWYSESDSYWNRDGWTVKTENASSSTSATVTLTPSSSAASGSKFRVYVRAEAPSGYPSSAADFDSQFEKAEWSVAVPAEKPEITHIDYDHETSDKDQPASGGVFAWIVEADVDADFEDAGVTGNDFKIQVKTGDGEWIDSSTVTASFETPLDGSYYAGKVTAINVPNNEGENPVQWRFHYLGESVDCPVITQAAAEAADPAVENVVSKISALPDKDNVSYDDKENIEAARAAYEALTTPQKAKISDELKNKLTDAEQAIKDMEDAGAADRVERMINDLPAAEKVTTADKEKIEAARAAYDALTNDQKAMISNEAKNKLTTAETALDEAQKAADRQASEDKAKSVTSVTIPSGTVNASSINAAIAAAGGSRGYVTEIVLGKGVKKISKNAFKGTKITTIVVQSKKLKKKSVKGSLKGSSVKTIKVKIGSKKINKKYVKKYKKIFTKKNAGRKVIVKR